jgi:hypothetical protein
LGIMIGGGVSAAGAASLGPNAHVRAAAHHVKSDRKGSESALEAATQDHKGQSEGSTTDVTASDPSGSSDLSQSARDDSKSTVGGAPDTPGTSADPIG